MTSKTYMEMKLVYQQRIFLVLFTATAKRKSFFRALRTDIYQLASVINYIDQRGSMT